MAQVKAVFYLPLRDNDGRDLTAERDQALSEVYSSFDGFTCLGEVRGSYRMSDGTRSDDRHESFSVVTDESRVGDMQVILLRFKSRTKQEAIYLEITYNTEIKFV